MLAEAFVIACFISSNPSPSEWTVSGAPADVDAVQAAALKIPDVEVVDRASGARVDFARFRFPHSMSYGDFMGLMNLRNTLPLLASAPEPTTPDCREGRAEDVGDAYSKPVIVGVLGQAADLSRVQADTPWAHFTPVALVDGRTSVAFDPSQAATGNYEAFVAKAAADAWPSVQIVLLQRARAESN